MNMINWCSECFWSAHHNDWSRWLAISSAPPICFPSFSFIGGVAKEYITKTWMCKILSQGHILSTAVELDSLYIGEGCFCYPLSSSRRSNWGNLHGYLGNWNPTENCFLTTYHPSFMVHWWVLVHFVCNKVSWRVSSGAPKTLNHGLAKVFWGWRSTLKS